jgi:hypothetical protein
MSDYSTQQEPYQEPNFLEQAAAIVDENFRSAERAQLEQLTHQVNGSADSKLIWTTDEILDTEFTDPEWIVPNLIAAGLNILGGRPKIGKSWFGLQAAVAVGTGGTVLGEQVQRRRVFYLALEDSERRLQNRLNLQKCPKGASIDFATAWPALIDSGLEHLLRTIEAGQYQFVVVDTLARFASERKSDDEKLVAQRLAELQRYAVSHNIGVLIIDHHRKPAAGMSDVIDDIMGATAKTGVADAALGLYRSRGQQGAELKLTGRDVPDRELAVQFDKELFCWQLLGNSSDVQSNSLQGQILELMKSDYDGVATCSQIAKDLGRDRGNIHREMQELVTKMRLVRVDKKEGREVKYKVMFQ